MNFADNKDEYQDDTRKLKARFAILYIASVVMLLLACTGIWIFHTPATTANTVLLKDNAEKNELLKNDAILHEGLSKLDELGLAYSKTLAIANDSVSLAVFNDQINRSVFDFSNLIDRINNQKSLFTNLENAQRADAIVSSFVVALNNRRAGDLLLASFLLPGNNKSIDGDTPALLQPQVDAQRKDDSIRNLISQLNFQQHLKRYEFTHAEQMMQPMNESSTLQLQVKRQRDSIKILMAVYKSLLDDNSNLNTQMKSLKANTSNPDNDAIPAKINSLNSKIDDLNAELILARINCNLTRANGKDVIYNSRQRKVLLEESLASLKNLAGSTNPLIQRKVKNELLLLQNIASTVRD